jgi:hypothetical protein
MIAKKEKEKFMSYDEPLAARISIRVTASEKRAFMEFCKRNDVTQRQGFQSIMMKEDGGDDFTDRVIQNLRNEIHRLKEENAKLKKVPRGVSANENLKKAFLFAKTAVLKCGYALYDVNKIPGKNLERMSWNRMTHELPDHREYHYPDKDCFFIFQIEVICYGKASRPVIFLYGTDLETGERVKLRFYAKPDYCGMQPDRSPFFKKGMCFFVGCRCIYSDVADLVFAFPMVGCEQTEAYEELDNEGTVQSLIAEATKRSQNGWF